MLPQKKKQQKAKGGSGKPLGSPVQTCPATTQVKIVDDQGIPISSTAIVKARLEVSNQVTSQNLPSGFMDASTDRDNFKIEINDLNIIGNTIPASQVEIEVLKPGKAGKPPKPFSPRRLMNVGLEKVAGSSNVFRSRYLRLVVDEIDKAAAPDQTILVDWDASDPKVEILGQVLRVKYKSPICTAMAQATVGGATRSSIRLAVHILRATTGGSGVVGLEAGRRRIYKWFRRAYAQISMAPSLFLIREVDPVQNLISISNDTGAVATGLPTSTISFRIRSKRAGHSDVIQVVGPISLAPGDSPLSTATRLASLVKAPFVGRTVQNPPHLDKPTGSADLIITDTTGGRVRMENLVTTDPTQRASIARVNASNLESWGLSNKQDWVVGSLQQRAVLHAYDSGPDRVDLFVVGALSSHNRAEAMIPGTIYDAGKQALPNVRMSAFLTADTMDGTDTNPFVCAHEVGHVLMDAIHADTDSTQVMEKSGTPLTNIVAGGKRFSESAVHFDWPNISIVQEPRIRSMGSSVLGVFP